MLHQFLTTHREDILRRARARVADRAAPQPSQDELSIAIPLFLDELIATLDGDRTQGAAIDRDATLHGERRQHMGFTIAQVVRDYGDIYQVVTELAIELRAPIDVQ